MSYTQQLSNFIFTPVNFLPQELQSQRLRSEVLNDIRKDSETFVAFQSLRLEEQEALVEFCMGNRGLMVTYDPFFQKLFNVNAHPERLNRLLSAILHQPVKIKRLLPREGTRLSRNSSLMIMDMLVELADGTLINVEIQKYGYYFPMQRSFCYGSDLLVRQYSQLRDALGQDFSYKKLKPVYVIILMDNSPKEFAMHPDTFLHRSQFIFDSQLHLENLLNFIYIPLDIFRKMPHNELGELEAWLYFLGSDNPQHIERLIKEYPFFKELYHEIINFRYHPKELIGMFSEALEIMDRNTINLMIDDLKKESLDKDNIIAEKDNTIAEMAAKIARLEALHKQPTQNT